MQKYTGLIIAVVVLVAVGAFFLLNKPKEQAYAPVIDAANFTNGITNPFLTLTPGTRYTYIGKTSDGEEKIVMTVLAETKVVMGVTVRMLRDTVTLDGELVEDTIDYFAQDKEGNVWYFGEETAEYENGVQTSRHGQWTAGVDGALPGVVMKAHPAVGDSYYQEFFKGEAEDRADVLSLSESVSVPAGKYQNCVQTYDYTPLDPSSQEQKFYCREVGFTALELDLSSNERTELVKVEKGVTPPPAILTPSKGSAVVPAPVTGSGAGTKATAPAPSAPAPITEAAARSLALSRVPGSVSGVQREMQKDKDCFVVEIQASAGGEKDVIIEVATGAVLAVE